MSPSPLEFPITILGVGMDIFWNHTINKFPIKQVSTAKSLSIHIDGNLSWECHINEISKKIASSISVIKRIRY